MTDGKTGLITPGGGGIEPVDPDWPSETDNGCDGWPGIEGFGGIRGPINPPDGWPVI